MSFKVFFRCSFICATIVFGHFVIAADDQAEVSDPAAKATTDQALPLSRAIYVSKHAAVQDLVVLLGQHFEGESGIRLITEPNSGLLSIRANTAEKLDEVLKLLAAVDRPQRQIAVQVLIIEFTKKVDAEQVEKLARELSGTAAAVVTKLNEGISRGQVAAVKKYRISAIENRVAELLCGEHRPIGSGFTSNAVTGASSPILVSREVGTSIELKPQIQESGEIKVDLNLRDSQITPLDEVGAAPKGADGLTPSRVYQIKLQTTLTVPSSGSNVATTQLSTANDRHAASMIVLSAEVVDQNNPSKLTFGIATPNHVPDVAPGAKGDATAKPEAAPQEPPVRRFSVSNDGTPYRMARDPELMNNLKLTNEQKQSFSNLNREWMNSLRAMTQRGPVTDGLGTLSRDFEQRYKGVLTEEQQKVWNARLEEVKRTNPAPARRPTKNEPGAA